MILTVEPRVGPVREFALDAARGDGIALHVSSSDDRAEPIPLETLTGLTLDGADTQRPRIYASFGTLGRYYPLWPESVLHVGFEETQEWGSAPARHNVQHHESFTIADLVSVAVDVNRRNVAA